MSHFEPGVDFIPRQDAGLAALRSLFERISHSYSIVLAVEKLRSFKIPGDPRGMKTADDGSVTPNLYPLINRKMEVVSNETPTEFKSMIEERNRVKKDADEKKDVEGWGFSILPREMLKEQPLRANTGFAKHCLVPQKVG